MFQVSLLVLWEAVFKPGAQHQYFSLGIQSELKEEFGQVDFYYSFHDEKLDISLGCSEVLDICLFCAYPKIHFPIILKVN